MEHTLTVNYLKDFKKELDDIDKLEQTPKLIKSVAIQAVENAMAIPGIQRTVQIGLERTKESLENIQDTSIQNNFKIIYSQMCILAVSSLEATLKKYFENALSDFANINQKNEELKTLKISLNELVENNLKFSGKFGRLILDKTNINFQDLKSIKRIFSGYISRNIVLDSEIEKYICFFLEARHVLVHKGGIVDSKFVQATNSFEANMKGYKEGDRIEISTDDWNKIKEVFSILVEKATSLRSKH